MNLPPFSPTTDWQLPDLDNLPRWGDFGRVSLDLETKDPLLKKLGPGVRRGAEVVGIGFACEGMGRGFYLPIRHTNGRNLDEQKAWQYIRDNTKHFKGNIVGANLMYDLDYCMENRVEFNNAGFEDVQVAEPLLDENQMSFSLDNIAQRRGVRGKDETMLKRAAEAWGVHPKKGLWELPPEFVGAYGEQDVMLPLEIMAQQRKELEKQGLQRVWELEKGVLPVLLKMRRLGVRIDFDQLDRLERWSVKTELETLKELTRLTGIGLSVTDTNRTPPMAEILRSIGIEPWRTDPSEKFPNGQDSITKDFLETVDHPVAALIRRARKFRKLRDTFVNGRRDHAIGDRVHCTLKQIKGAKPGSEQQDETSGAKYGRLACSDPNLQQEPARDPEIGPEWRKVYIPDDGGEWACLDFSQQEPRWLYHYAELDNLPGAAAAAAKYRTDPTTDSHQMMADIAEVKRKFAKEIFLGLCYGMGSAKLSRKLGFGTKMIKSRWSGRLMEVGDDECQALLSKFHRKLPFLDGLVKATQASAAKRGFIRTAGGRICRFPAIGNGKYDFTHKALNRLIQGSSGDQTKQAMVDADAAGVRLQLQVHDELDFTIWNPSEALECAKIMREALPCNVPHRVDIEVGPNWASISEPDWAKEAV